MAINDFSCIIQLSATLLIAFVAVDYVKSYISILVERVFRFQKHVKDAFEACRAQLTDNDTLNGLEPVEINGKSTIVAIEEVKRKVESLSKEIDETETAIKNTVTTTCFVRSMSAMCFFLFMCDVVVLFAGAIEYRFHDFAHVFSILFCVFSIIYLFLSWYKGESENQWKFLNFASIRFSIVYFFIIFAVAFILSLLLLSYSYESYKLFLSPTWWYTIFVFVLLTYMNYIVFMFKIKNKTNKMREEVNQCKNVLIEKCKESKAEVSDLMATARVDSKIRVDNWKLSTNF